YVQKQLDSVGESIHRSGFSREEAGPGNKDQKL
ncbi:hypothetical protein IAE39_002773, partial [Pseudomonas sp. S37]|nr:hypothetical protein [Pseudomonas sp. S37]